ncbi:ABC transporter ATP-binding protein [Streptomyces sp. NBC_01795]|uniref:ABC transporter ATP-binding protein n=1 Tax=unclassified Streptomyces TaxID=2593676 RepID=UPI002DD9A06C|nr:MULTISPECIES: ABC transporter ATP-binding protein [unclassified Streptomyces]WSA92477.1 ABC transporter ATP-binding protein [Streptomyces sp. NBC_01795]WSB76843.1 ABC transporter ATP-binding protein [Streptomyces sp. NBC_01775]WSS14883.1 ABC transporter ATP-binding protein [Streptomyces sp. NBC_01186]
MPKIRASGLTRTFGRGSHLLTALGPVELEVARGEFVCVVGPSGCGKSTLLRIAAGLLRPSAGELELRTDARHPAAMIFQDYGIYGWKTVLANVRFGLDVQRVPRKEADTRAREWLGRMGLAEFEGAYPAALSGGMRQRVAIARALAVEPEILLMDEPFAALDAQLRTILQDELLALTQATSTTTLFITHSLEEALVLGDRVLVMSAGPGRIIAERRPPFGRPRTGEVRSDPGFTALKDELWELLRYEVRQAGQTARPGQQAALA